MDSSISPSLPGFYEKGKWPSINLGKKADNEEKGKHSKIKNSSSGK